MRSHVGLNKTSIKYKATFKEYHIRTTAPKTDINYAIFLTISLIKTVVGKTIIEDILEESQTFSKTY